MPSPALDAAVARIRAVFGGMASPGETGCTYCYREQDLALLRVPDVPLPEGLLVQFFHEVSDHFTDYPAVMRRLLPQFAQYLVEGRFDALGYSCMGLGRYGAKWPEWPAEQAAAIREFIDAWWLDRLRSVDSPYRVTDVFAACADMGGTITPLLDLWARQPLGSTADALLVGAAEYWIDELLYDDERFALPWWEWYDREVPLAELQAWLATHAPARLRAAGADGGLITRVELLALPEAGRWEHPYWSSAQ